MTPIRVRFKASKRNPEYIPGDTTQPMYVDYDGLGDLIAIENMGDFPSGVVVSDAGDFYVVRLHEIQRITTLF
jgi:hypothetical protein